MTNVTAILADDTTDRSLNCSHVSGDPGYGKGKTPERPAQPRAGFPEPLLQGGCLSVTHLEEVEDVVSVQPVVTEAVENLHSGAQGKVLEAGLPQRVGLPLLQLPAVVDDVLQVAVEGLRPSQWSQTQRCVITTQRIGGWGLLGGHLQQ